MGLEGRDSRAGFGRPLRPLDATVRVLVGQEPAVRTFTRLSVEVIELMLSGAARFEHFQDGLLHSLHRRCDVNRLEDLDLVPVWAKPKHGPGSFSLVGHFVVFGCEVGVCALYVCFVLLVCIHFFSSTRLTVVASPDWSSGGSTPRFFSKVPAGPGNRGCSRKRMWGFLRRRAHPVHPLRPCNSPYSPFYDVAGHDRPGAPALAALRLRRLPLRLPLRLILRLSCGCSRGFPCGCPCGFTCSRLLQSHAPEPGALAALDLAVSRFGFGCGTADQPEQHRVGRVGASTTELSDTPGPSYLLTVPVGFRSSGLTKSTARFAYLLY